MKEIKVEYNVDEGVPVPVRVEPVPFHLLEVGQSIKFPLELRPNLQSKVSKVKPEGKEYTIKKINDEEARIWRTK